MYFKKIILAVVLISLGSVVNVSADNRGAGNHYMLNLVGSGDMYLSTVPDIDGDGYEDDALCFDIELINAKNRRYIGTATDCLSNINLAGTGIQLVGTTYFYMPEGTLVTRGSTTVQPVLHPTVTPSGQVITHITGASGDGNAVIAGTGRFAGVQGTVRLSGMVDMTDFTGAEGTPIVFDCLFVVDLDG